MAIIINKPYCNYYPIFHCLLCNMYIAIVYLYIYLLYFNKHVLNPQKLQVLRYVNNFYALFVLTPISRYFTFTSILRHLSKNATIQTLYSDTYVPTFSGHFHLASYSRHFFLSPMLCHFMST